MMSNDKQEKIHGEGPRSFAHFVSQICDGEIEQEASLVQQKLLATLEEEATTRGKCKGRMTLTLEYEVDNKGNCTVGFDVTKKEPKKMHGAGQCWLTKGSNYTMDPPGRRKGIREVGELGGVESLEEPAQRAGRTV
jgi:hypothetical protein